LGSDRAILLITNKLNQIIIFGLKSDFWGQVHHVNEYLKSGNGGKRVNPMLLRAKRSILFTLSTLNGPLGTAGPTVYRLRFTLHDGLLRTADPTDCYMYTARCPQRALQPNNVNRKT